MLNELSLTACAVWRKGVDAGKIELMREDEGGMPVPVGEKRLPRETRRWLFRVALGSALAGTVTLVEGEVRWWLRASVGGYLVLVLAAAIGFTRRAWYKPRGGAETRHQELWAARARTTMVATIGLPPVVALFLVVPGSPFNASGVALLVAAGIVEILLLRAWWAAARARRSGGLHQ